MAQSYENLKVWKDSIELASRIYVLTRKFPKDEQFGLVSQMRRAVISILSNIAEGSSRKTRKDYMRFLDISIGSLNEVESLLHVATKLEFVPQTESQGMMEHISALGILLGGFRKYLQR